MTTNESVDGFYCILKTYIESCPFLFLQELVQFTSNM